VTLVFPTPAEDVQKVAEEEKKTMRRKLFRFAFAVGATGWDATPTVAPETLMNVDAITRVLSDDDDGGGDVCRAKR